MGKTALGSLCAGIALLVAVRVQNQAVQIAASAMGACLLSYTGTTYLLDCKRRQKSRLADAEAYLEFLRQINQERLASSPMPKACQGCGHYHGQVYGGNLFVCAMHPYGVEDTHCADWQSF